MLKNLKLEEENDSHLNSWDIPYYMNKWKKKYGLNDQNVKKYFPLKHVVNEIFKIYYELFDVKFVNSEESFVWHNDVQLFTVYRKSNIVGYFYLDIYNRKGKYKQTRVFSLQPNSVFPFKMNKYLLPIVALIASFDKPSKRKDTLISHSELISIFHEFSHVLHNIFGKTKYCLI